MKKMQDDEDEFDLQDMEDEIDMSEGDMWEQYLWQLANKCKNTEGEWLCRW